MWNGSISGDYDRFKKNIPIDPDMPIYKRNFLEAVGSNIRQKAQLDLWVSVAAITHMSLTEFLNYDEFWQQAIFEAVDSHVKDQNKQQQQAMHEMTSKLEDNKPYISPMTQAPRPQFLLP